MKFNDLSFYLDKLEKTSSRLEITAILSDLFSKTPAEEIDKVIYLSLGTMAPNYEGIVLNLAEKMMIRAIALANGLENEAVLQQYKEAGDLGVVAERLNKTGSGNLSVEVVFEKLLEIARDAGEGSQEKKLQKMSELLKNLDSLSTRFVTRIPIGKLRLGFSEKTVIDALANHDKTVKDEIETAYNIRPDIGYIGKLVKNDKIKDAKPKLGVPIVPMLAQRLNSASEMIKKMGTVSVEPKFDGLRIFIHFRRKDNFLRIFTRNMNYLDENIFPELKGIGDHLKADELILDTEAVGIDPKREMFLDFQKTMQRRRKHDVEKTSADIPLQFQVFDLLLLDGKSLIKTPYIDRRNTLQKVVKSGSLLRVDENTLTDDPQVIKDMHNKYLKMGLEGVVVKRANSFYVSGRTGWNWVKMKEVEGTRGKLSDTLDCIIMGYTAGKGKRVGFGVGQFLAGVKKGDSFTTVTKVGTGLSDEQFKMLFKILTGLKTDTQPKEYEVNKDLAPDFWVTPEVVVELAADEITVSPKHTAGFALRFPRLIRFRDDKNPKDATTVQEVEELFKLQKRSE